MICIDNLNIAVYGSRELFGIGDSDRLNVYEMNAVYADYTVSSTGALRLNNASYFRLHSPQKRYARRIGVSSATLQIGVSSAARVTRTEPNVELRNLEFLVFREEMLLVSRHEEELEL